MSDDTPQEWAVDPSRSGEEFGAGPLHGCPNCFTVVWIPPKHEEEACPSCGYPGEFDELHVIAKHVEDPEEVCP